MKIYKAAVIGCGGRAPAHIEAYRHIPNSEVVACCAPSPLRREDGERNTVCGPMPTPPR